MDFVLDITKGKTRAELADDYLRSSRAAFHWQRIAMRLIEAAPEAVAKLPPENRDEIARLIEAYRDDDEELPTADDARGLFKPDA